jgi:hypothetical protein
MEFVENLAKKPRRHDDYAQSDEDGSDGPVDKDQKAAPGNDQRFPEGAFHNRPLDNSDDEGRDFTLKPTSIVLICLLFLSERKTL